MPEDASADAKALVTIDLTMQALDPYLSRMDIVCHDPQNVTTLTQQFNAENFLVRGGAFEFYVPEGFAEDDQLCSFTFDNLYTPYLNKLYYGNNNARCHAHDYFVNSSYEQTYPSAYGDDAKPSADYKTKISVSLSGTEEFVFSNAEDLDHDKIQGVTGDVYYEEYPFTKDDYSGDFTLLQLKNGESDTRYIFCADEPIYNISPATATEHRAYAFYEMTITLLTHSYKPTYNWTKVYNTTCYADKDNSGKEIDAYKPMFGLTLGTSDKITVDDPDGGQMQVNGYLTIAQINQILTTNLPAGMDNAKQVLYVDASDLHSVVYSKSASNDQLASMKASLGDNALIFLPEGTSSDLENVAMKSGSGYRTAGNVVITDRKPFFSPYDIQVDGSSDAIYQRKVTWATQGRNTLQTLILPFTLKVTNGVHSEEDGPDFTLSTLNAKNCLSIDHEENAKSENFYSKVYFTPIEGTTSMANVPYMVEVANVPSGEDSPIFKATQTGAKIYATTFAETHEDDYLFEGIGASGTIVDKKFDFSNQGSYSGVKLTAADGYFYFAGGKYLNSKNISENVSKYLLMYPFRSFMSYDEGVSAKVLRMGGMEVVFGENPNETNGIRDLGVANADLMVKAGNGTLTITSTVDQNVRVNGINGMLISDGNIPAGETRTMNVPSGIYVVNGVKIIVK